MDVQTDDDMNDLLQLVDEFDTSLTEEPANIDDVEVIEPQPSTSSCRFKPVSQQDIEALASNTTEKTTKGQTKWAVKTFKGV